MYCVVLLSGLVVLPCSCLCLPARRQDTQISHQLTLKLFLTVHSSSTYELFNTIQLILKTTLFAIHFQLHFAALYKNVIAQLH